MAYTDFPKNHVVRVGAVIEFSEGTTKEAIEDVLICLGQCGLLKFDSAIVREFNPEWGHPVWYIP